jgi:hypothetical protein
MQAPFDADRAWQSMMALLSSEVEIRLPNVPDACARSGPIAIFRNAPSGFWNAMDEPRPRLRGATRPPAATASRYGGAALQGSRVCAR